MGCTCRTSRCDVDDDDCPCDDHNDCEFKCLGNPCTKCCVRDDFEVVMYTEIGTGTSEILCDLNGGGQVFTFQCDEGCIPSAGGGR